MWQLGGLGIAGYKSFGPEIQYIRNLNKINIFIGKNNSGKSNILSFLLSKLPAMGAALSNPIGEHSINFGELEFCSLLGDAPAQFSIGFKLQLEAFRREGFPHHPNPKVQESVDKIYNGLRLDENDPLYWLHLEVNRTERKLKIRPARVAELSGLLSDADWNFLSQALLSRSGGQLEERVRLVFGHINPFRDVSLPLVEVIPAIREIRRGKEGDEQNHSGVGLIEELAALERPTAQNAEDRTRFETINQFVRDITGKEDAEIQIPHDRSTINVLMDGRYLPLASVGTGIHEIIILAAKCMVFDEKIVCI